MKINREYRKMLNQLKKSRDEKIIIVNSYYDKKINDEINRYKEVQKKLNYIGKIINILG